MNVPALTTLGVPRDPASESTLHAVDASPFAATDADAELLGVRINDIEQPDAVLVLRLPHDALAVPVSALAAWRVRRPTAATLPFEGREYVALSAVAGAQWRIDAASQTLVVRFPSAAFVPNNFEVVGPARPLQAVASLGGFVNYDLQGQRERSALAGASTQRVNGLIEAGVFNAHGNGVTSGVWRSGDAGPRFTRLDTTWSMDLPASVSSLRLGDTVSVAGASARSVRFGGVQWATNFSVQPGLVSFPMPSVRGEATVPSVVDLYVNNVHQLQGKVPPGAFDLPDVPVVTGQGQIKMVVRDLLGREQVIVQPFYVSPTLLREGLHDFALEAGAVREDYGLASQRYGRVFAAATDRVGVSPSFTRELHAEGLREQQTLSAAGTWQVMQRAIVNASAAASRGPAGTGGLVAAGVEHQSSEWSANLQGRVASRDFAQLGQAIGFGAAQRALVTAGAAASIGSGGVAVNVLQQSTWGGDRYRSVNLSYGRTVGVLGHLGVYASRTFGDVNGTTVGINLITVLGANASASVGSYRSRDRASGGAGDAGLRESTQTVVQLQGNAPAGPGIGYQVQAERGAFERVSAEVTARGERAELTAGVGRVGGVDAYRAGLSGGVALMPEGVYFSRRIDGSFAVVKVGDYAGVRVNRDNQPVARTDDSGRAFVGGLRGFESNQLSVEAGDLPLDAQVDQLQLAVAPGRRSGVSVVFPVQRTRAASLRLVTLAGTPVPAGVTVRLQGDGRVFPVGFDGKLFLAGLGNSNRVVAEWDDQRCEALVLLAPTPDDVPELGMQVCR